jgi:hypothetical protein
VAGAGDDRGGVEQGVAEAFRFGSGEVAVEAQFLASDEEVVSDQAGGQPAWLIWKSADGRLVQPVSFRLQISVATATAAALTASR